MSEQVGILGAGGQANEAASYVDGGAAFFALDDSYRNQDDPRQIDILKATDKELALPVVSALGAPAIRVAMVEKWAGTKYATIIAEQAYIDASSEVGEGSIVAPGAIITTNVKVGRHSIINIGATVSHDSHLGDFTTICPGAHIAGGVTLKDGVFVGIGASIKNGISVARGVVIGAGAVVVKAIETENSIVAGVPAKEIGVNDGWLKSL